MNHVTALKSMGSLPLDILFVLPWTEMIKRLLISDGRTFTTSKLYRHEIVPMHLRVFLLFKLSFSNLEPCHSVLSSHPTDST